MSGTVAVRMTLLPHAVGAPSYETEHAAGMDLRAAIDG
jgi:dUTPase